MSPITKTSALLGLFALVAKVSAHGFVEGIDVDGTFYTGYMVTQYPYQTNPPASVGWTEADKELGFIAPDAYGSGDIICHKSATNAQLSATVEAGKTVTMFWNAWPESHHGPVIDYIASCNGDCSTVEKTALEFVKIAESGLISDDAMPGKWASDTLISNNNSWAITIPSTLKPGSYVLRHEIIALHSANQANGAQNYPQCINLEVTGSGTASPAGTLGKSLYTATDRGIAVDIYNSLTYTIPGPKLWSGSSSGESNTQAVAVTSAAQFIATTSAPSVPTTLATVVKPSSTSAPVAVATDSAEEEGDACEL